MRASVANSVSENAQRRRAAGEDVLDLSAGEPEFDTPRASVEAGVAALQQGETHAPPDAGTLDLRAAAARQLSILSGGRPVNADNIIISNGVMQAVFNACFTLFSVGDEVLVPTPCWWCFCEILRLARAKPIAVPGDVEWSLKVGVDQLDAAANAQTKGIILSTPVNPTGAVYTRSELKRIAGWAKERGFWIISDELYRRIHYGSGPAPSVLDLPDGLLERGVTVTGVSPAYAMSGWSVGLALGPRPVVEWMTVLQSRITGGPPRPVQHAATAAFTDERVEVDLDRMLSEFRAHRDVVVRHFREQMPGVEFVEPLGTFYFFFRVDGFFGAGINSASRFCERLLAECGVALLAGAAFGDDRWVRLSYAISGKALREGLTRISDFTKTLAARAT
jgi:aspartate aminotransferase